MRRQERPAGAALPRRRAAGACARRGRRGGAPACGLLACAHGRARVRERHALGRLVGALDGRRAPTRGARAARGPLLRRTQRVCEVCEASVAHRFPRSDSVGTSTQSEANAEYDTHAIAFTSALHAVPKERRMTFDDGHQKYSRLEAMRVAKEQASIREKAADYTRDGQQVPEDLVKKYNRTIQQKLRRGQLTQASISALVHADENKDCECLDLLSSCRAASLGR